MKINSSKIAWMFLFLLFCYLLSCLIAMSQANANDVEGKVKTVYDSNGRPVNQGQDSKGLHRVTGTIKLVAGVASVTLNTNINEGRQDISFISASTYRGQVWMSDTTNANTYGIYPQSGIQFIILSSDAADTNTVNYWVEGE